MSDSVNTPIMENTIVKEFLSILKENGKDTSAITSLLNSVTSMENQLNKAVDELQSVRHELNNMKEERDHPVRTALQSAAKALEAQINNLQKQLSQLKTKIIDGCRNAISAFKTNGKDALNNIAKFFKIKPALESLRGNLQNAVKSDQSAIDKIGAMSKEIHSTARSFKNIGRVLVGKEAIPDIKPNGKLSKLIEAPFRNEIKHLSKALKGIDKAISALDNLDKVAPQKTVSKEQSEKRPSVVETMKALKAQIDQQKKEAPAVDKSKHVGAEL